MARQTKAQKEAKAKLLIQNQGLDVSLIGTVIKTFNWTSLIIFGKQRSNGDYMAKFSLLSTSSILSIILAAFIVGSTKWLLNDFCDEMTANLHIYDLKLFHKFFESHESHGARNAVSIFMSNVITVLYFVALTVTPVLVGKNAKPVYWVAFAVVLFSSIGWNAKVMSINQQKKYSSVKKKEVTKDIAYVDIDSINHSTVVYIANEIKEAKSKKETLTSILETKSNSLKVVSDLLAIHRTDNREKNKKLAKDDYDFTNSQIHTLEASIAKLETGRRNEIHKLNVLNTKLKKDYQSGLSTASTFGWFAGLGLDLVFILLSKFNSFMVGELKVTDKTNIEAGEAIKTLAKKTMKLTSGATRLNGIKIGLNKRLNKIKTNISKIKPANEKIKTKKKEIKTAEPSLFEQTELNYSEAKKEELIKELETNRKYKNWHHTFIELACSKNETGKESEAWIDGRMYNREQTLQIAADDIDVSINTVKSQYRNRYTNEVLKAFDSMELHLLYKKAVDNRKGVMS